MEKMSDPIQSFADVAKRLAVLAAESPTAGAEALTQIATAVTNLVEDEAAGYGALRFAELTIVPADGPLACPECHGEISGTLEYTSAVAYTSLDEQGGLEYEGGTESDQIWNNQSPVTFAGLPVLVCGEGHCFAHRRVAKVPNDEVIIASAA
jgi:hypothetical protein